MTKQMYSILYKSLRVFFFFFVTAAASIQDDILLDITLVLGDHIAVRISHCCYRMTLVLEDHIASC